MTTPIDNFTPTENEIPRDGRHRDNLDPNVRKEISRKGGLAVSQNRQHMAEIGRKGGEASGASRQKNI